jgi:Na+-transporting NADH:ubiquinone oxidoreductase subunit NqrC
VHRQAAGSGKRDEVVAEVDNRMHGEAPGLGGTIGMPKYCRGGVREGGSLSLHLGELVVCVRDSKLSKVAQGIDHCAAR